MASKYLYRVPEAAEATGISRSKLYELMSSGRIESVKLGGLRLIPAESLEDFVAALREESAGDAA